MASRLFRKLAGLDKLAPKPEIEAPAKPDQQAVDVAIASQRVNERADRVRALLADLLKANDGIAPLSGQ